MGQIAPRPIRLRDGSSVLVRTALPEDAPGVIEHLDRMFRSAPWVLRNPDEATFPLEQQRGRLDEWLFDPRSIALIAERTEGERGRIVGMLVFARGDRRKVSHTGEIGMGTDPDARGTGVGTALLRTLLDWAVDAPGLSKVTLRVVPENVHAMRLYAQLGFVEEARLQRHLREDDGTHRDLLAMAIYVKPDIAPPGFRQWPVAERAS